MVQREQAQRGAEAAEKKKKRKKSHSVFLLTAGPQRAVPGWDNGLIRTTCVWLTFLHRSSDSHVRHRSCAPLPSLVSAVFLFFPSSSKRSCEAPNLQRRCPQRCFSKNQPDRSSSLQHGSCGDKSGFNEPLKPFLSVLLQ